MAEGCDLSRTLEGGSDYLYENECAHCRKFNDISLDGNVFCTTCKQYLCRTCGKYHVRNMPSHQIKDVSTMQTTQSVPSSSQSQPVGTNKETTLKQRKKYTLGSSKMKHTQSIPSKSQPQPVRARKTTTRQRKLYFKSSSKNVNIKVKSDNSTSCIDDMCQLSDRIILIIDSRNNKLKRLDDKYNIKDFLEFKSHPAGICSVSSFEVAVRLDDKIIQFISVNESLTYKRQVSINHPNPGHTGLVCCSDQFLVPGNRGVYVYSLSGGSFFKKIEKDSQDRALFPENPAQRIAVSYDGSMVYVTAGGDRVVVFNKNGDYIREIRDERLEGTCGICITCDDIVLVSGVVSSNVLMFDKNGVGLGELVSKTYMSDCPWSLCFDKMKCRSLVGDNDTLQVFDLD